MPEWYTESAVRMEVADNMKVMQKFWSFQTTTPTK